MYAMRKKMPLTLLPPFQPAGVQWLLEREKADTTPGGFLCDEMGIGKTAQLVAMMCRNPLSKTLIVVPKSIVGQWRNEIHRFTDGVLPTRVFDGPNRIERVGNLTHFEGVVIAPYSVMCEPSLLHDIHWNRLILDEGHEVRNPKTKIHMSLKAVHADIKWIVTGTPVFNSIRDFVALCSFIGLSQGTVLRDYDTVRTKYVLRRTKQAHSVVETIELDMYPEEQDLYMQAFQYGQGLLGTTDNAIIMLEAILRLRQMATWPQLFIDGLAVKNNSDPELYTGRSRKHEELVNSILSHPDEKTLVFTQFTVETDRIQELLVNHQIPVFRIDGHVTDKTERESRIEAFRNAPANAVFLIQIRAGGVGLNLQEASRVYITSPAWNPATELQAIGRADRTGQTRTVHVIRYVYKAFPGVNSIEEFMMDLHEKKSEVVAEVLGEKKRTVGTMTMRTIAKIFKV
ncbi:DEAD/DEAH box helicase [bacterium]|nr:DEAD/DEAH box helicase [bacterium]